MDTTQLQDTQTQPASQGQPQITPSNRSKKVITIIAVLIVFIAFKIPGIDKDI